MATENVFKLDRPQLGNDVLVALDASDMAAHTCTTGSVLTVCIFDVEADKYKVVRVPASCPWGACIVLHDLHEENSLECNDLVGLFDVALDSYFKDEYKTATDTRECPGAKFCVHEVLLDRGGPLCLLQSAMSKIMPASWPDYLGAVLFYDRADVLGHLFALTAQDCLPFGAEIRAALRSLHTCGTDATRCGIMAWAVACNAAKCVRLVAGPTAHFTACASSPKTTGLCLQAGQIQQLVGFGAPDAALLMLACFSPDRARILMCLCQASPHAALVTHDDHPWAPLRTNSPLGLAVHQKEWDAAHMIAWVALSAVGKFAGPGPVLANVITLALGQSADNMDVDRMLQVLISTCPIPLIAQHVQLLAEKQYQRGDTGMQFAFVLSRVPEQANEVVRYLAGLGEQERAIAYIVEAKQLCVAARAVLKACRALPAGPCKPVAVAVPSPVTINAQAGASAGPRDCREARALPELDIAAAAETVSTDATTQYGPLTPPSRIRPEEDKVPRRYGTPVWSAWPRDEQNHVYKYDAWVD